MRNTMICGLAAAALALAAHGPARAQDNTLTGALLGGAAGAGVGYAFGKGKGAAIGGVTGLALGALAGNAMQRREPPPPAQTYYAPPPGYYAQPQGYYYAPAPVYGAPVPAYAPPIQAQAQPQLPSYSTANCREYSGTIMIDGQEQRSYGTACLQPDGSWRIVR
jgi:surface antigen